MASLKPIIYFNSITYSNLSLVIVQFVLFALTSNIDTITKELYLRLNRNFKLALMICRSTLIIVTIVIVSLFYALIVKLNNDKESEKNGYDSTSKSY